MQFTSLIICELAQNEHAYFARNNLNIKIFQTILKPFSCPFLVITNFFLLIVATTWIL